MNKKFKLNELRSKIKELASFLKEGASKPKTKKALKTFGKSLLTIFLIGVLTVCIVTVSIVVIAIQGFESGDFELEIDKESLDYTSIVYGLDEKGEYAECERIWAGENRIWVDYDKIPQDMKDAVVAVEDKRFLDHNGVDWGRTVLAFANMFFKFYKTEFGASTITQQLVKNLTGENQHRIDRKIKITRGHSFE